MDGTSAELPYESLPTAMPTSGAALQEKLQQRRFELKQALLAEAMRECTFKPRTNEGQNRELINRILRADEAAQECY